MLDRFWEWLQQPWLWWLGAASAVMFVAGLVALPMIILRLPADYFIADDPEPFAHKHHPAVRALLWAGFALVGLTLIAAGVIMLFIPGQGLLSILMGIMLLPVPGKRGFARWMVHSSRLVKVMNHIRSRYGKPPLKTDPDQAGTPGAGPP